MLNNPYDTDSENDQLELDEPEPEPSTEGNLVFKTKIVFKLN